MLVHTPDQATTMTAIINRDYGPPDRLELTQINKPAVGDDDVLVAVRAVSLNPYDGHLMRGEPYIVRLGGGLRRPNDPRVGVDMAGQVVAVGKNVTQFRPGDAVFGGCGGAFAEYACGSADRFAPLPANISFAQAAALPMAGFTALQALRDSGQLAARQRVLINGAAGGVGTLAVQLAKAFGAQVTGVCSTGSVELVRSLGADHVVDYTREDFARRDQRYDLVLDLAANRSLADYRRVLASQGTLVLIGAPHGRWLGAAARWLKGLALSRVVSQRLVPFMAQQRKADLEMLKELVEAGTLMPVIDRVHPWSEAAEAFRYLETGRAHGKIVLTVHS